MGEWDDGAGELGVGRPWSRPRGAACGLLVVGAMALGGCGTQAPDPLAGEATGVEAGGVAPVPAAAPEAPTAAEPAPAGTEPTPASTEAAAEPAAEAAAEPAAEAAAEALEAAKLAGVQGASAPFGAVTAGRARFELGYGRQRIVEAATPPPVATMSVDGALVVAPTEKADVWTVALEGANVRSNAWDDERQARVAKELASPTPVIFHAGAAPGVVAGALGQEATALLGEILGLVAMLPADGDDSGTAGLAWTGKRRFDLDVTTETTGGRTTRMAQARDLRPGEAFTAKHALGSEGELLEVRVACATVDVIEEGTRKVDRFVALKPVAAADAAADVVPDTPAPDSLATALADAERLGLSPRKDDPAARKALVERMVRAMEADKDAAVTAIAEVGAGHRAVQDGVVVRAQLLLAAALQATPKMPWAGREVVQTTRRLARTLADAPAWEPKRATWLQMLVTTLGSLPKGTAGVATALAEADRAVKRDTRANSSLVAALAAAKRAHGSAE